MQVFTEGEPGLLIWHGQILDSRLKEEFIARDELYSMLRQARVANTGEVRYGFLEITGELGIILYPEGEGVEGESTLKDETMGKRINA